MSKPTVTAFVSRIVFDPKTFPRAPNNGEDGVFLALKKFSQSISGIYTLGISRDEKTMPSLPVTFRLLDQYSLLSASKVFEASMTFSSVADHILHSEKTDKEGRAALIAQQFENFCETMSDWCQDDEKTRQGLAQIFFAASALVAPTLIKRATPGSHFVL